MRLCTRLLAVTAAYLLLALPAAAQSEVLIPLDDCVEVDHFPPEPIGLAPSTVGVFATLPPAFAGGNVFFLYTGPSGDQSAVGLVDEQGLASGQGPLYEFGVHSFTDAFVLVGNQRTSVDFSVLGDGGSFTVDESEPVCDPGTLTRVTTTTTAAVTTTTPSATSTTTEAADTTTTTSTGTTDTVQGGAAWPLILIVIGFALFTLGWLLWHKPKDPCEELRKLWEAAERRAQLARESLEQARRYLEEKRAKTAQARAELDKLVQSRDSSITEYGLTRHLIDGGFVTTEGLESLIATQTGSVELAEQIEASAAQSVADWETRVGEYEASAAEAKAAYERCIGRPTAATPGTSATGETATGGSGGTAFGGGTTTGTGGPAVASTPQAETRECEEGTTETRPAGGSDSINVTVDFSLFVEVEEGSERKVGEAQVLALDLSNLARELDTLGNLMDALGAGRALGEATLSLKAGEYVEGAKGVIEGGIGTYKAAADPSLGGESFDVFPPTSPEDAVVEVLKCTAQLGALVASKVGEWMEMNQLYNIRLTYFYQTVTATPYQIWKCQGGHWVCAEKVFHYSVSNLQRRPGPRQGPFRLESDIARAQFQREIDRMVSAARGQLEQSARGRAEFNQRHRPGPCS